MSLNKDMVLAALKPIQDPDLHRSIVDLDFIQNIEITGNTVSFDLVLTTPACPVKDQLKAACEQAVQDLDGVDSVEVTLSAQTRSHLAGGEGNLEKIKNIIAVASGKGGVAKSTTAVNIAASLAATGAKVGVFDADIYGPSIPIMMKCDTEPKMGEDGLIQAAISGGVKVISIGYFLPPGKAAILRGPMASGYVTQFLTKVDWGDLDYLIIDYPPGTGDIQLTLSQQTNITGAVLCTTPQRVALADVEKAIRLFETTKVPVIGVIETMSYFICGSCDKQHNIFGSGGGKLVAELAGVDLVAKIPILDTIAVHGDTGVPHVIADPDSPAATAYKDAAGKLAAKISILNLQNNAAEPVKQFNMQWQTQ